MRSLPGTATYVKRLIDFEQELNVSDDTAVRTAEQLFSAVERQSLGDPDPDRDVEAATQLLVQLSQQVADLAADVAELRGREPGSDLDQRLAARESRLSRGSGWPRAVGQSLVSQAIWEFAFETLGLGGIALKALVWTIITVYQVVGFA